MELNKYFWNFGLLNKIFSYEIVNFLEIWEKIYLDYALKDFLKNRRISHEKLEKMQVFHQNYSLYNFFNFYLTKI